jgi:hypothetical protein
MSVIHKVENVEIGARVPAPQYCVEATMAEKVKSPKLKDLKERPCSLEELQAALIKLIELHNGMNAVINRMVSSGQIRSRRDAIWDTPFF